MTRMFTKRVLCAILSVVMLLSVTTNAHAVAVDMIIYDPGCQYYAVKTEQTVYGTVYHVQSNTENSSRAISDVLDVLMAGVSWAQVISDPSLENFGWAVLDTVAVLPLLPSTAYFREGGKIVLKTDEIAKFAKTASGQTALSKALKPYQYSDGITSKAVKAIKKHFKDTEGEKVLNYFIDAANKGFVGGTNQAGIKAIKPNNKIDSKYTHEIKILNKQYGDYRIFGYKAESGEWVFDLFREGLH